MCFGPDRWIRKVVSSSDFSSKPAESVETGYVFPGITSLAERFELYLGRSELANGYQELTDAIEQQRRFDAENTQRLNHGKTICKSDRHLVAALEHGLPECAGVALGVDRLLMAISGVESIAEVTAFPSSRA